MTIINRLVYGTVLACTVLAALAAGHNHTTKPCTDRQVGAVGMCATVPFGGAL